jgi:hypothetical protein
MRRTWAWAGVVLAAVVGCNDSGPPKRSLAKPVDDGGANTPPVAAKKVSKPDRTDPAAEAVIEKLLKAHTGGKPELIEPLKTHAITRKGQFTIGEQSQETVWRMTAAWPDRYRVEMEWPAQGGTRDLMVQNGPEGWKLMRAAGDVRPVPFTPGEYAPFVADAYAEWATLLVPLLDAAARVAALPPDGAAGKVWVWVAGRPAVLLSIDEKSGLLTRVDYEVPEVGGAITASLVLSEHKPVNGVLLPTKVDYSRNNRPTARWASSEVEFPKAAPADAFTKP